MRVHLTRQVVNLIYALREDGQAIRAAIEEIRQNPKHPDAITAPGKPGRREFFVRLNMRGYWIGYEIEKVGGETVIVVASVEQN
jgi:hypothetical protein